MSLVIHRSISRAVLAAALVVATCLLGCGFSPTFPEGKISCRTEKDCPPGFTCVVSVCRGLQGAGTIDAGDARASVDLSVDTAINDGQVVTDTPVGQGDGADAGAIVPDGDAAPVDVSPDSVAAGDAVSTSDRGCPDGCALGNKRCATGGLQTCVMVGVCPTWSVAVPCSGRQTCQGAAPAAQCQCPSRPAGCEAGAGSACVSGMRKVCAADGDGCVYDTAAQPCTCMGSFPGATCSCPAAPAGCSQVGTTCQNAQTVLSCTLDSAGCLTAGMTVTCPTGKPCTGMAPSATCSCGNPPAECAAGAGKSCRADGQLVTCALDATTGCLMVTSTAPCATGLTCQGPAPSAACKCPTPPADCANGAGTSCRASASIVTCVRDANGCLVAGAPMTCPAGKICTGTAPSAACTCPPPPANCQAGPGTLCNSSGAVVTCGTDPASGCLAVTATTTCASGLVCGGTFPTAGCMCAGVPAGCAGGVGRSCSGTSVVTCTHPAGMCFMATTTACPATKPCGGTFPGADCTCPTTTCISAGSSCSGNNLITCTADASGCLQPATAACGTSYCSGSAPSAACRTATSVGSFDDLGGMSTRSPGYLVGRSVTLASAMTLRKFGLIARGTGNVSMGLYSDVGGNPSALLAKAEFQAITVVGRNEFVATAAGAGTLSLAAGTYWIMVMYETQVNIAAGALPTGAETQKIVAAGWDTLPASLPSTLSTQANPSTTNYYLLVTP